MKQLMMNTFIFPYFGLGSAIMVGPNLMGLFEQMNIDEEFKAIGKPTFDCVIGKDDMEVVCKVDFRHTVE